MQSLNKNVFLSENSKIFDQLADAQMENVGTKNPIPLPVITINAIGKTIGEKITHGNIATIYRVNDVQPSRVYKIIPYSDFINGDEIRISKIASELSVAPLFYSASIVEQGPNKFVLLEMEEAGKTLGKWMEDLGPEEPKQIFLEDLSEKQKMMEELKKKFQEMDSFTITEIPKKKRIKLEEAAQKIYGNEEKFYCELFNKIKILAENCICYRDSHVGNIIPNCEKEKELQLIDFDAAVIVPSSEEARENVLTSTYNLVLFNRFKSLPNLSEKSNQLISWFS